jgi:DNA-binding NarL/FixJ family response regulator
MSNGAPAADETAAGVLICDDNESLRILLTLIVDSSPGLHVVGEAADGNQAIAEAIRVRPNVIMLDLAMPNRSGLAALPELRRVAPDAQIIVFSGFASGSVADQAIALGATTYLEKGAPPDTILATIEAAVANATAVPASLIKLA